MDEWLDEAHRSDLTEGGHRVTGVSVAKASACPPGAAVVQTAASPASSSARLASTLALTNKVTTTSTDIDDNSNQSAVALAKTLLSLHPHADLINPSLKATENDEEKKRALEDLGRDVSSSSTKPTLSSMERL